MENGRPEEEEATEEFIQEGGNSFSRVLKEEVADESRGRELGASDALWMVTHESWRLHNTSTLPSIEENESFL